MLRPKPLRMFEMRRAGGATHDSKPMPEIYPWTKRMKIGNRIVGHNQTALIIAELGLNANGSLARAIEMVRVAAKAGCEAIKIQAFTPEEFCGAEETYTYLERNGANFRRVTERQLDMFRRCALTADELVLIATECKRLGLLFGATATDQKWITALLPHVDFFKIGSDDIVHIPLLRAIEKTKKPVILSTGMATGMEIQDALRVWVGRLNMVAILHCVSLYPTPLGSANLRRMGFPVDMAPVGYSDHAEGIVAATVAICRDAAIVEKHFTLDKELPGPDHWFSANPTELASLCGWAKAAHAILGSGEIDPSPKELEMRKVARRSIVAARDVDQGQIVTAEDLAFRRPGTGMSPALVDDIVGRPAVFPILAGAQIKAEMLGQHVAIAASTSGYLN